MTDPMTPLTEESERFANWYDSVSNAPTTSWVYGTGGDVIRARLRAIEAAAARRAIEGSGVERCAFEGCPLPEGRMWHDNRPGNHPPTRIDHPFTPEVR